MDYSPEDRRVTHNLATKQEKQHVEINLTRDVKELYESSIRHY